MVAKQASTSGSTSTASSRKPRKRCPRYIAAVRFSDGRRGCFSVDNATTPEQARSMVVEELPDVASVLVAIWH